MTQKKSKKPKKVKRIFNYGAKGIDVTVGHTNCVPKGKFPWVPKEMGWLWTSQDVPGLQFRPDWRPGAVRRSVVKLIKRHGQADISNDMPGANKSKKKSVKSRGKMGNNEEDDEDNVKPAFSIQKRDGDYYVTLQQLRDTKGRSINEYPYTDDPPYQFKVQNQSTEQFEMMKKKREKIQKHTENLLIQQAFDNICKEIYQNMDKCLLKQLAVDKQMCLCQALQTEILNNCTDILSNLPCTEPPLEEKTSSICVDESWTVEFTPPCAKFDPNRKYKNQKVSKGTQFETGNSDFDDDTRKSKSNDGDGNDNAKTQKSESILEPVEVEKGEEVCPKKIPKKPPKVPKKDKGPSSGGGAFVGLKDQNDSQVECVMPDPDPMCCVCPQYYEETTCDPCCLKDECYN